MPAIRPNLIANFGKLLSRSLDYVLNRSHFLSTTADPYNTVNVAVGVSVSFRILSVILIFSV